MELYETSKNISLSKENKIIKQFGSFNYSLPPNKSGKQTIKFSSPYVVKPAVFISLSCELGDPLSQFCVLSVITEKDFTVHVENNDLTNEAKCTVNWYSINT